MINTEYNLKEMQQFLNMTGGLYDIVRLIDPYECRQLTIKNERLHIKDGCYDVWDSDQRCINCSSYKACMTGQRREKEEYFADKVYHILSNPVKLRTDDSTVIPCVIEFITAHTASEKERINTNDRKAEVYEAASLIDPLTGLLNWDGFHQNTRKLLKSHADEPCILIACSITQFKLISSLYGRQRSNEILTEISRLLAPYASDEILVGRLQADEFAICMPKALFNSETFRVIAENATDILDNSIFSLQFLAGIYEIKDSSLPVSVIYDRATMALTSGLGKPGSQIIWFDDSMLEDLLYRQRITTGFEKTMSNNEYQIFLQPQVDGEGTVYGAEALSRWVRPGGDIVPPIRFIPILEEAGLIAKLDCHVWELAVKQLKAWENTEFSDLWISVNISALDFYYIDVYEALTSLVEEYGIEKKKLKLEITESAIMSDAEKQISRLKCLREYGFAVEIDDFGAGYSSLAMLKDIEADVLKIDMAFLRETEHAIRSRQVLLSIVEMASRLGMETITEGVETTKQLDMLTKMGCNMFQGFYFSKPLPIGEFEAFAREHLDKRV